MKNLIHWIILIIIGVFAFLSIYKGSKIKEGIKKNKKFTISRIENIKMSGKSWSECSYYIDDILLKSDTKIITDSELKNYLGKYFLVEYDSLNKQNSNILLQYPAPDSIKSAPPNGWKELPNWAKNNQK